MLSSPPFSRPDKPCCRLRCIPLCSLLLFSSRHYHTDLPPAVTEDTFFSIVTMPTQKGQNHHKRGALPSPLLSFTLKVAFVRPLCARSWVTQHSSHDCTLSSDADASIGILSEFLFQNSTSNCSLPSQFTSPVFPGLGCFCDFTESSQSLPLDESLIACVFQHGLLGHSLRNPHYLALTRAVRVVGSSSTANTPVQFEISILYHKICTTLLINSRHCLI